ncbi:MAG: hypothetical protein ACTSVC_14630, partial [Promethearchaeota archaeon]
MVDLVSAFNKINICAVERTSSNKSEYKSRFQIMSDKIFWIRIGYFLQGKTYQIEGYIVHYGDPDNIIWVTDINKKYRQLILKVKEPERVFKVRQYDYSKGKYIITTEKTSKFTSTYLCGSDEKHLFISTIPQRKGAVNTVLDAHKALQPELVQ